MRIAIMVFVVAIVQGCGVLVTVLPLFLMMLMWFCVAQRTGRIAGLTMVMQRFMGECVAQAQD
ncbi:MAG: hypothetical protein HQ515_13790 [Phycisphaeraceae bacterium]|nr:hypothetical protein [Phycisphaeraceae bacterium]